ncbi:MAG: ABC transporter substrate-binding protein [Dehalococcoidales bacterium]
MRGLTRLTVITAALIVLLTLSAACQATDATRQPSELEAVSVRFSWHDGAQFLGFYVAQERGYYAEEGLEVAAIAASSSEDMDSTPSKVARDEIDFGVGSLAGLFTHRDEPVTVIATVYQYSPSALFAKADSGIATPADLAGRTVAIKNDSWRAAIQALLELRDLALDDIEEVPGSFDTTPFYEDEVEVWAGYLTNEVVRARRRGMELVTFPLYEYGVQYNDNMIYTGREALAADPDRATRFLRATLRGWEWAVANPREAVDIMLERFPEMADDADFHLASFEASIPLIRPGGVRLGVLDCNAPQFMGEPLPDEFCSDEVLDQALEGD